MSTLVRHQVVLTLVDGTRFTNEDGTTLLNMDPRVFAEMAQPDVVTVTVEPGDRLQDDDPDLEG